MRHVGIGRVAIVLMMLGSIAGARQVAPTPVHFPLGKRAVTLNGALAGEQAVEYALDAAAGQRVNVTLTSGNSAVHFDVAAPGSDQVLFDGVSSGSTWTGTIVRGGTYIVRVYRTAAGPARDRATYTLTISVSGASADR